MGLVLFSAINMASDKKEPSSYLLLLLTGCVLVILAIAPWRNE